MNLNNCMKYIEPNDPIKQSWYSLGASLIVAALAGTPYAYGAFSPAIKRIMNYGQSEITLLTSIGLLGMFSGVFTGTFYDHMGARPTLLIGSLLSALCYYIMYLQFSLQIDSTPTSVRVAYFFANVGNSFRIASATAVCIKNFPSSQRGKLVGLAKGYFAVGASMYSQLYLALFPGQVDKFFFFLTLETFVFMILCYPYFIDIPVDNTLTTTTTTTTTTTKGNTQTYEENEADKEKTIIKQLNLWYILTFFFAAFLTIFSVFQSIYRRGSWNSTLFLIGISILAGCMIWLANYKVKIRDSKSTPDVSSNQFVLSTTPHEVNDAKKSTNKRIDDLEENALQVQVKHLPLTKAVFKITFWLLFLTFFMICGCALVVYNNVAQLKFSLVKIHKAHLEVTVLGVGSLLGRTGIGYVSDTYRESIPREGFLIICSIIMAVAMAIFSLGVGSLIVPASFLTSLSYGGMFCLIPSLTADYYGSKYYAGNYGALDLAPAIGSFFYASYIVQLFYKDSNIAGIRNCVGRSCFQGTFIICLFSSIGGVLLSLALYKMMARKKK